MKEFLFPGVIFLLFDTQVKNNDDHLRRPTTASAGEVGNYTLK